MKVYEDNGKALIMVKVRDQKDWQFLGNTFWESICCLVLNPIFGLGSSRLW